MHTSVINREKSEVNWRRLVGLFALLAVLATACASEPASSAADNEPSESATTDNTTTEAPTEEATPASENQVEDLEAEEEREVETDEADETDAANDPAEAEPTDERTSSETGVANENPESLALADEDPVEQVEPSFIVGCSASDWVSTGIDEDGDGVNDFTLTSEIPGRFSASTEPSDLTPVTYSWEFIDLSGTSADATVEGESEISSMPPPGHWMVTVTVEANGETNSATCEGTFIVNP